MPPSATAILATRSTTSRVRVGVRLFLLLAGVPACMATRAGQPGTNPAAPLPPTPPATVGSVAEGMLGTLPLHVWQLENGLRVVTLPDPAARAVSIVTTFRVGSRHENADGGETGLAHLFEHLMFTGAPAPGRPDFDQQIEEVGGTSNAETSPDVTTYMNDVPPDALERVLHLEAARMRGLALDEARVANERRVVIEERLATIEDSVDGTMEELVWRQAFRTHPYRRSLVGSIDDIKAITRAHAQAFYRRHYAPDRAVLVIAGRFDESAALALIASGYAGLSRGDSLPGAEPAPERGPDREVRAAITRPVPAERLLLAFPAPALGGADRPAYEVLAEALVGSPASRLARQLIIERTAASSVTGEIAPTQDPGLWLVWIQMQKGHTAREAEDAVVAELARAGTALLPDAELTAAARRLETAFWRDLAGSHGRAEALAEFEAVTGDCRNLLARGAAYAQVSADDVRRVARSYFGDGARAVVVASPGGGP